MPNHIHEEDLNLPLDSFREYSAWIGGSMLGSLSTFKKYSIFKSDYDNESGE